MMRATLVSLYCNIVLVIIKSTALLLVNSLAIAVDLGISFVGLTVSVILFFSMKLANRPADLLHNYGYGKVEHVCEALEGVVLIGIALAMSSQAMANMLHPKEVSMPWIGVVSCAINLVLNFGGSYYILKMAKKSRSPAIKAEAIHFRLEGFISTIIGASFVISMFFISKGFTTLSTYIDPGAALLVSIFLIIPSFKLAKNSFFKLLDVSVEEESQMEILKQLSAHMSRYCEFKDIKSRTAGRKKFVECKIIVPESISLKKGYEIVRLLEKDIKAGIHNCEVRIKMEPCKQDCEYARKGENCPYVDSLSATAGRI